jgi:hypothetical protein
MASIQKKQVKPNIFVATPMYGGMCTGIYAINLAAMPATFKNNNIELNYSMMMNESLITRARNKLAHDFLKSNATHLMFIDADIGFSCMDIVHMLRADKDIICGIYPKKEINWHEVVAAVKRGVPAEELHTHTGSFVVNLVDGKNVQTRIDTPIEIENGGTGFMLIKREVFEGLTDKVPSYSNDMFTVVNPKDVGTKILEFFDTSISPKDNRLLSEDYHFCQLARNNGFKIWAAPWVQLTHMGTYAFNGQLVKVEK